MKNFNIIFSIAVVILISACATQQPISTPKADEPVVTQPSSGNVVNVAIKGFKFVPADVTVKVGDTVVLTNEDTAPHTVESSDAVLKSDELSKGDTFQHTFKKAGKHDYICGIHPSMKGSVTVQ